ncbi:MAG: GumC family protein [Nitrospirae bacterium]|nr:GumC family protein [Nitrospirota bacterium]
MPERGEIDLRDSWAVVKRRKGIVLGSLVVFLLLGVSLNALVQPVYRATSLILIEKEPTRSVLTGAVVENPNAQSDALSLDTAVGLITNRTLLERVVTALREKSDIRNLDDPPSVFERVKRVAAPALDEVERFLPQWARSSPAPDISDEESQRAEFNAQVDLLFGMITVEPVRGTRLVNIHVDHQVPAVAKLVGDTLSRLFIEYQTQQGADTKKNLTAYMTDQLSNVKGRIEESERAFYAFKDREGLFSLDGKLKELSDKLASLNASYVKIKTDRLAAGARLDKLREIMERADYSQRDQLPIESQTLDTLRRDLSVAQTELAKAKQAYKSRHPKVKTLESAVASIEANIRKELDNAVTSLKAEHAILISREENLKSASAQTEQEMHGINKKALEYSTLDRELNTNRDLYNLLLAKLKESDITGKIQTPVIQLVHPAAIATEPPVPIRPRKVLNLALSVVVGLMVGLGLAFFKEYVRRTIRTSQDVMTYLHLPVLGMIPKGPQRWKWSTTKR